MNRARVFLTGLCLVVGLATPLQAISLEGRDQSPSFALDTRTLEGRSPSGPFVLDTRTLEGRSQSLSFTLDTRTLEGRGQSLPFVLNTSPGLFLVLNTSNGGLGSLRQALQDANVEPGMARIEFAIPGAGPHCIQPLSPLPVVTDSVVIDGYTQPGAAEATETTPANLMIELQGSPGGGDAGLVIQSGGSTVRGLAIGGFAGAGIRLVTQGENQIEGCYLGTDATGTQAMGNGKGIVISSSPQNRIGGVEEGEGNVIAGNASVGILISGGNSTGNVIQGNYIGTDTSGTAPLGNGGNGVRLDINPYVSGAPSDNRIGGPDPGAGNLIAHNAGAGVAFAAGTGNTILSNAIHSNGGLGIDLGADNVTYNDLGDDDDGANHLLNSPVIATITRWRDIDTIEGIINSTAHTPFRLEFFSNTTCNSSQYGEGEILLHTLDVTTDGQGYDSFAFTAPRNQIEGRSITATATDPDGNTSEFARCTREIALLPGFSAEAFYRGILVPDGLAVRDDGSLLVVHEANPQGVFLATRGDRFDLGDRFSTVGSPPFASPDDLLLHPDGTVFVTDGNPLQTLFSLPPQGGTPTAFVTPGTIPVANNFNPFGIAFAPSGFAGPNVDPGDLIVADNAYSGPERAVWAIHPTTGEARAIAQGDLFEDGPSQVAFTPDRRLFVHENYWISGTSRIVTLGAEGIVTPFLSGIPGAHQSLCIHPITGEVYFGLGDRGEIRRMASEGSRSQVFPGLSEVFAADLVFFQDIAFAPDGLTLLVSVIGNVLEITGRFFEEAEETPQGPDVVVQPPDPGTGTQLVTLTFAEVAEGGYSSVRMSSDGPPPDPGFGLGDPSTFFDVSTTATFTEPLTVRIDYAGIRFDRERDLRLFHYENGRWFDVTTRLDPIDDTIYGEVTSLSPFAIFERKQPVITALQALPADPIPVGTTDPVAFTAQFADPVPNVTHTAEWNWGDGSDPEAGNVVEPTDSAAGTVTGSHLYADAGVYTVTLTLTYAADRAVTRACRYVVIYDPEGGFATGGGWINSPAGAYMADPDRAGKAHFEFNPQYDRKKGSLKGKARFRMADLEFRSTALDWLVVDGTRVWLHGVGVVEGKDGSCDFLLTAIDGAAGGEEDAFRLQIRDLVDGEALLYDSQRGETPEADPAIALGGGSIVIHPGRAARPVAGMELPTEFALKDNFPNPFNPRTHIRFALPEAVPVTLEVYNMWGQKVATLIDGETCDAGHYEMIFAANRLASGLYLYRLQAGSFDQVKKMTLVK